MRLMVVSDIVETCDGVAIQFEQGARGDVSCNELPAHTYEYYIDLAKGSLQDTYWVGVVINASGRISQMRYGDNDIPADVIALPGKGIRVRFLGHAAYYIVEMDHPRFSKLRELFEHAITEQSRVWFVSDLSGDDLVIHDATLSDPRTSELDPDTNGLK